MNIRKYLKIESINSFSFLITIIAIVIFIPYFNSLLNGFVWLDQFEIVEGKLIVKTFDDLINVFFINDQNYTAYHRPIYNLMHSLDYFIWELNPFGYHLSSLTLHIFNCVILFLFIYQITKSVISSFMVSLFWGLHPINTSVVSLVHSKADLLSTFFILAILCIWRFSKELKNYNKIIIITLFLLGLFSKETVLLLPFIMLYVYLKETEKKQSPQEIISLFVLGFAFIIFRLTINSYTSQLSFAAIYDRIFTFIPVYGEYFIKSITGFFLSTNDSVTIWKYDNHYFLKCMITVCALFLQIVSFIYIKSTRVGIVWYNLFLIPVSQIIPILHFRADRFLYLPMIGIIWALFSVFMHVKLKLYNHNISFPNLTKTIAGIILIFFGIQIVLRNNDFKNNKTLFEPLVKTYPNCREAHSFLAYEYLILGEYQKAGEAFKASLSENPKVISYVNKPSTMLNFGVYMLRIEKYSEAYNLFESLITEFSSKNPEVTFNLAVASLKLNKLNKANYLLNNYLNQYPNSSDGLFLLGKVTYMMGQYQDSLKAFERYLQSKPNAPDKEQVKKIIQNILQKVKRR